MVPQVVSQPMKQQAQDLLHNNSASICLPVKHSPTPIQVLSSWTMLQMSSSAVAEEEVAPPPSNCLLPF